MCSVWFWLWRFLSLFLQVHVNVPLGAEAGTECLTIIHKELTCLSLFYEGQCQETKTQTRRKNFISNKITICWTGWSDIATNTFMSLNTGVVFSVVLSVVSVSSLVYTCVGHITLFFFSGVPGSISWKCSFTNCPLCQDRNTLAGTNLTHVIYLCVLPVCLYQGTISGF